MNAIVRRLVQSRLLLYTLLLMPGWELVVGLATGDRYFAEMMHVSGVLATQFLVITLSISFAVRLVAVYPRLRRSGRWLIDRRRDFGLVSFIYAMLHLLYYARETADPVEIWLQAADPEIATGWLAFLIMLALAATSNHYSRMRLGTRWKLLHRFVYAAAALCYVHWYLFAFKIDELLIWLAILIVAKTGHAMQAWRQSRFRRNNPVTARP